MTAAVPSYPPFEDDSWRPSRDFFGGPPPVDPADPTNVPSEPVGEVPPEFVFTAGGAIATPKQARRYASGGFLPAGDLSKAPEWALDQSGYAIPASHPSLDTFLPLLDKLGPGAAAMVEREMDRARAFEVIARAAVEFIDAEPGVNEEATLTALIEAVAENRAAIQ